MNIYFAEALFSGPELVIVNVFIGVIWLGTVLGFFISLYRLIKAFLLKSWNDVVVYGLLCLVFLPAILLSVSVFIP